MSAPAPARRLRRLPLTEAVIALCAVGTSGAVHAGALSSSFAVAFGIAAAMRLLIGFDGGRLLPVRALQLLGCTASAALLAWLFQTMSSAGGAGALWALMAVMSVYQTLVLLWAQKTFSSFLLILFSSVHATGLAFPSPAAPATAWFVGGYLVVLVVALLLFERSAALEREEDDEGAVQRVRADTSQVLPPAAMARMAGLLLAFGLPLGAVAYLAAPRGVAGWFGFERVRDAGSAEDVEAGASDIEPGRDPREEPDRIVAETGPGRGAPLGSVAEIKRSLEPWFEVSLDGGQTLPPTVILRDNVQDRYWQRGVWTETLSQGRRPSIYRDLDDDRNDGWYPLGHHGARGRPVTLRIRMLRGGQQRLYLQPQATELQILRGGRPLGNLSLLETENATLRASVAIEADDVIVQRYVDPVQPGVRLAGRRSDSAVAPQISYLQVPREVAPPLRARALAVVGAETDPWRRAKRLEAWLKSEAFTYTLRIPPLDPRNPVVDFVERTRSANCEAFAFSLTLMLRTLGHPARYVRGFWGGDVLENRKTVILRGSHYHAWTEMFLDGVGWVALNPTPPDRTPADAGTVTAAQERVESQDDAWEPISFLGFDEREWRRFWQQAGARVDAWLLQPLAALFGPRGGWLGWPLLLALAALVHRRRGRARLRAMVVPRGTRLPGGAYGKALLLLAKKGMRRGRSDTPREFARAVARRLPSAGPSFARLTRRYEAVRFGGRSVGAAEDARLLAELQRALAG